MNKQKILFGVLLLAVGITAYSQVVVAGGNEDGPTLRLTGEVTGMMTIGSAGEEQAYNYGTQEPAPGFYYRDNAGNFASGKNGYYSSLNFSFLFNPVSFAEIYMKLLAQYRPGSPYLPLQLEDNSAKTFEDFTVDAAYGRINVVKGLGFDLPLDIWLKAGKFDSTPAHYNRVSRYGAESVMNAMKTMNRYAFQLEAAYALPSPSIEAISAVVTTNLRLNEALPEIFDEDVSSNIKHGSATGETVIPIHAALRMKNLSSPFGSISAELLYAYNGMHIFSGQSFGIDIGLVIPVMDALKIPIGIGAAFHEKNTDVLANTSISSDSSGYTKLYDDSGYHQINDINTVGLRQAMRIGFGAGAQYNTENLGLEFNAGFALSNIAHIYRDTISLPSLSVDLRASWQERCFVGGGIFLGTLVDTWWNTKSDVNNSQDISTHAFTLAENMGWEAYAGLQFSRARFVIGYNCNKGLSMNNSIESIPEAQIKYKQKGTLTSDGLFETGGLFTKVVISW